jgi:hypothetical protein
VRARKKIVDATIADTQIPALTPPPFEVAAGVKLMAPNDLPRLSGASAQFVILGAGKTAIDTVVWLLANGADPDCIIWVRPRDAWLLDRATVQPDDAFFDQTFGAFAANFEAAKAANSVEEIFLALEARGYMHRIDQAVTPSMYRCAIVSDQELAQIRRVKNVVRLGHVRAIESGKIVFESGELPIDAGAVMVNCTACGIPRKAPQPMFQPGKIAPQYLRICSPTFSGAVVAKLEISLQSDDEKNALSMPVPIPNSPSDWVGMQLANVANTSAWRGHDWLMQWMAKARLDQFVGMIARAHAESDSAKLAVLKRYYAAIEAGAPKLMQIFAAGASA